MTPTIEFQWSNPKNGRVYNITRTRPVWHGRLMEFHRLGFNDGEIGRLLGKNRDTVRKARITMGLPRNAAPGGPFKTDRIHFEDGA